VYIYDIKLSFFPTFSICPDIQNGKKRHTHTFNPHPIGGPHFSVTQAGTDSDRGGMSVVCLLSARVLHRAQRLVPPSVGPCGGQAPHSHGQSAPEHLIFFCGGSRCFFLSSFSTPRRWLAGFGKTCWVPPVHKQPPSVISPSRTDRGGGGGSGHFGLRMGDNFTRPPSRRRPMGEGCVCVCVCDFRGAGQTTGPATVMLLPESTSRHTLLRFCEAEGLRAVFLETHAPTGLCGETN